MGVIPAEKYIAFEPPAYYITANCSSDSAREKGREKSIGSKLPNGNSDVYARVRARERKINRN